MSSDRKNPFQELLILHERLTRSFDGAGQPVDVLNESTGAWNPAVDVFETADNLVIKAELPGLYKDDVVVTVEGDRLIIQGERNITQHYTREQMHRIERSYGSFRRVFHLPSSVSSDEISAFQEDGVLTIVLPRGKANPPKRIQVNRAN